jgi:NRAMP (natural resistance-associated macrophage protein)-like metal ion transporter
MSGFLNFKMAPWKRSCVTRTVAIVPTLVIAVVFQASHKLDQLNQLLNILQSIMLPFAIIPVSMSASLSVWVEPTQGLLISVCIGIAVPVVFSQMQC